MNIRFDREEVEVDEMDDEFYKSINFTQIETEINAVKLEEEENNIRNDQEKEALTFSQDSFHLSEELLEEFAIRDGNKENKDQEGNKKKEEKVSKRNLISQENIQKRENGGKCILGHRVNPLLKDFNSSPSTHYTTISPKTTTNQTPVQQNMLTNFSNHKNGKKSLLLSNEDEEFLIAAIASIEDEKVGVNLTKKKYIVNEDEYEQEQEHESGQGNGQGNEKGDAKEIEGEDEQEKEGYRNEKKQTGERSFLSDLTNRMETKGKEYSTPLNDRKVDDEIEDGDSLGEDKILCNIVYQFEDTDNDGRDRNNDVNSRRNTCNSNVSFLAEKSESGGYRVETEIDLRARNLKSGTKELTTLNKTTTSVSESKKANDAKREQIEFEFKQKKNEETDAPFRSRRTNKQQPPSTLKSGGEGLGTWRYDKVMRKRCYISLQGKKLFGKEGMNAQKEDEEIKTLRARGLGLEQILAIRENRQKALLIKKYKASRVENKYLSNKTTTTAANTSISHSTSASDIDVKFLLETYNIPSSICNAYARKGIKCLLPWQAECLNVTDEELSTDHGALDTADTVDTTDNASAIHIDPSSRRERRQSVLHDYRNLVYSAPTSAGKTLVADILMLRSIIQRRGQALFVVPQVSLVEEKTKSLQHAWGPLHLGIVPFHGNSNLGVNFTEDVHVGICTIERASSIVNRLIEDGSIHNLKVIVIDELHTIGNSYRGTLIELMLAKLMHICGQEIQIIGLSATLPNLDNVVYWLRALKYVTTSRPVELSLNVLFESTLFHYNYDNQRKLCAKQKNTNSQQCGSRNNQFRTGHASNDIQCKPIKKWNKARELPAISEWINDENLKRKQNLELLHPNLEKLFANAINDSHLEQSKNLVILTNETVKNGKSVLVFCATKAHTVSAIQLISTYLIQPWQYILETDQQHEALKKGLENQRLQIVQKLRYTQAGINEEMAKFVMLGCCYHHAGLTTEERSILEDGYRAGTLSVMTATSTLAAGVNLPAQRVIIRTPKIGIDKLDATRLHQMCGRAGRYGIDSHGEAILMLQNKSEWDWAVPLLIEPLPKMTSQLDQAGGIGIQKALLECVVSKVVKTVEEARNFFHFTFLLTQKDVALIQKDFDDALLYLLENQFFNVKIKNFATSLLEDEIKDDNKNNNKSKKEATRNMFETEFETEIETETASHQPSKLQLQQDNELYCTQLAKAAFYSAIPPMEAVEYVKLFHQAKKGLILNSDLHLLYLVLPLHIAQSQGGRYGVIEPNWSKFADEYREMEPEVKAVGEVIGIDQNKLEIWAHKNPEYYYGDEDLNLHRRFFEAIFLLQLLRERPLQHVVENFQISGGKGTLQRIQRDASTMCGMLISFCRHLNWENIADLLVLLAERLEFGVQQELLPLARLGRDLMPSFRARRLFDEGITDLSILIAMDPQELTEILLETLPFPDATEEKSYKKKDRHFIYKLAHKIQATARQRLQDDEEIKYKLALSVSI